MLMEEISGKLKRDYGAYTFALTGSFARGEESSLVREGKVSYLNDLDLAVICGEEARPPSSAFAGLREHLKSAYGLSADIIIVGRKDAPAMLNSAFYHDLKHYGKFLAGDPALFESLPASPGISPEEGEIFIFNRSLCLLEALYDDRLEDSLRTQKALKAVLDPARALLILRGIYAPGIKGIAEHFRTQFGSAADPSLVEEAAFRKISGGPPDKKSRPGAAFTERCAAFYRKAAMLFYSEYLGARDEKELINNYYILKWKKGGCVYAVSDVFKRARLLVSRGRINDDAGVINSALLFYLLTGDKGYLEKMFSRLEKPVPAGALIKGAIDIWYEKLHSS